jgi:glutaminase
VETVDGRTFSLGDDTIEFSLQSCSKPLAYCLALEELGYEVVQKYMSIEASGARFNAFTLTEENKPFNPFVNSGAIVTCSLLLQNHDIAERFSMIQEYVSSMAGGVKVGFNNSIFLSERSTADRNRAIAYWLV